MSLPTISTARIGTGIDVSRFAFLVSPILAVAVSVLILLLVVFPKFRDATQIKNSNRELETRISALNSKVQTLSTLDITTLEEQLSLSENLLPSDKNTFSFIRQVEQGASTSGVILNKVDVGSGAVSVGEAVSQAPGLPPPPGAGSAAKLAPEVILKVSLTSDYKSLLNFLSEMYGSARVTAVHDLVVSTSSSPETALLKASMTIETFYKPLPTRLGAIESPVEKLTESEVELLANAKVVEVSGPPTAAAPVVPSVPTGKEDLFAPFQ